MCLSLLWRAVALEMQDLSSAQRQLLFSPSLFFFFFFNINLPKMETGVVTWGWMGWVMLLLGSLGGIAVHCDLIRFSYHHLLRPSFIFSHLWWAVKHFMIKKHILGLIKNCYQIAYRCFDSPSNQKEIQSCSLSFTGHPQWGRGDLGRWGRERYVFWEVKRRVAVSWQGRT